MKKKLIITLLTLTTMFLLGTSSLVLASPGPSVPNPDILTVDNGIVNNNQTGGGTLGTDADTILNSVGTVIKSTDAAPKFALDGTKVVTGNQVLKATVVGPVTTGGDASVVVSAGTGFAGKTVTFAVATGDTAIQVATKAVAALNADATVKLFFIADQENAVIILTTKVAATNDTALGFTVDNATSIGLTLATATSSTNTTAKQRTHGEYQNNTNSCASCHQTHTAASENLLFKNGVYNTCTACHDGTLGFYNVFTPSTAGTFAGTAGGNASVHMANGTMEAKAAPGGNRTGKVGNNPANANAENWSAEFTCASCHSPHGSYSDRLLNFNPNGIAAEPMLDDAAGTITGTTAVANGGLVAKTGGAMVRGQVLAAAPSLAAVNALGIKADIDNALLDYVTYPEYATVEMAAQDVPVYSSTTDTFSAVDTWRLSLPAAARPAATDKVVVVLKRMLTKFPYTAIYVKDTAPWINGGEYNHAHSFKVNYAGFYTGAPMNLDSTSNAQYLVNEAPVAPATAFDNIQFNYQYGFAKLPDAALSVTTKDKNGAALLTNRTQFTLKGITYPVGRYLFKSSTGTALTALNCKDDAGVVVQTDPATSKTTLVNAQADISRAFVISLTMDPIVSWYGNPTSGVKITQVSPANYSDTGKGVAISTFCAACHTDYLAKSGSETGVWSKAFRHSTTSDTYTCLKCHFAHGSDVSVVMDAQDRGVDTAAQTLFGWVGPVVDPTKVDLSYATAKTAAEAYLLDKNPSSALKRYTNMSVCWKCHTSSHNVGLVNNAAIYNAYYDADTTNNSTIFKGFVAPSNSVLPYFKTQDNIVTP